jgi:RNA polymerase sporulation-specific sigma factor
LNYKDYNDYELIYEVRENNEDAYNILILKYTSLINKMAHDYYIKVKNMKVEYDDLVQEGYVGLFQALGDYNEESCLFYTYASICIKREMERMIKTYTRNKHMVLNDALSLQMPVVEGDELYLEDVIASKERIEDEVIGDINYNSIMELKNEMPFEMSAIFELKANKFTTHEICTLLDLPRRKVETSINNIKRIVKSHLRKIR